MNYEDAESIAIGKLAQQLHVELKGEALQWFEWPCPEAMAKVQATLRETDEVISALLT